MTARLRRVIRNLGKLWLLFFGTYTAGSALRTIVLVTSPWSVDRVAFDFLGIVLWCACFGVAVLVGARTGFIQRSVDEQHRTLRDMQQFAEVDPIALLAVAPHVRLFARGWVGSKEDRTAAKDILRRIEAAKADQSNLPVVSSPRQRGDQSLPIAASGAFVDLDDLPVVATMEVLPHARAVVGDGAATGARPEERAVEAAHS